MTSVGSYEAKTHLPELLERVEKGERIVITRRGQAIAMLVPCATGTRRGVRDVINAFKAYSQRQRRTLGRLTVRAMIDEGRRH